MRNSVSTQKMAFDFNNICRLCMAKGHPMIPIFEGVLSIRIMSLVPLIKLHTGDGLPSQVCQQCEYQVNTSYKFKVQCENSDTTLRKYRSAAQSSYHTSTRLNNILKMDATQGKDVSKQKKSDDVTFEIKMFTDGNSSDTADPISKHHSEMLLSRVRYKKNAERECKEVNMQINRDMKVSTNISSHISQSEENSYICNAELLVCQVCGKIFPCKSKLNEHSTIHTGVRPYACGVCSKRFTRQSSLNVHMVSHTGHRPHGCEVCGKQFTQHSSLKNHVLIHTGQRPRVCEVCGRRFARLDNLKSHVLIHTGHKSYVCEVCGKMFNKLALLKTHATTHMERKPLFCDICGKSFVNLHSFKTHALIHSGLKPFSCGICRKSFTLKNSLKIHIQTHTGLKPHECGVCGKRFSQSHSLKTHAVVHTGQKPFSCQVCGKCFKQRHTLKKHEKIHSTC